MKVFLYWYGSPHMASKWTTFKHLNLTPQSQRKYSNRNSTITSSEYLADNCINFKLFDVYKSHIPARRWKRHQCIKSDRRTFSSHPVRCRQKGLCWQKSLKPDFLRCADDGWMGRSTSGLRRKTPIFWLSIFKFYADPIRFRNILKVFACRIPWFVSYRYWYRIQVKFKIGQ